jgi:hypothetical protein
MLLVSLVFKKFIVQLETLQELREKKLITEEAYQKLHPIYRGDLISVFYDIRSILYLGVLLFTSSVGVLIYNNIGSIGHIVVIGLIMLLTLACAMYIFRKAPPYTHGVAIAPTPYFDYIVLLGCLLFVSMQGYVMIQFELWNDLLSWSTIFSAIVFFFVAYRFDHLGVLTLGIASLASYVSVSINLQQILHYGFWENSTARWNALSLSLLLIILALLLNTREIKKHFTFTYLNISALLFFCSTLVGFFESYDKTIWTLFVLVGSVASVYYGNQQKSFLFLLYGCISSYIVITYFAFTSIQEPVFYFIYLLGSCMGFVMFIIRFKHFFKRSVE